MKIKFIVFILVAFGFLPELVVLSVSCAPKALSQGTVEVWQYYECDPGGTQDNPIDVNLDGGQSSGTNLYNNMPYGTQYTFPNTVTPGNHTLNFSFYPGDSRCAPYSYNNGSAGAPYSLNFTVEGGQIYQASVTNTGVQGTSGAVSVSGS